MTTEKIKDIGILILKGMKEQEACVLTNVKYSDYIKEKEENENFKLYIEKQMYKFKLNHLEVIQKNKSEKNSMYLLEKLRPEEFGPKSKNEGPAINIINAILKEVQNDNANPIVTFNRAKQIEDSSNRTVGGTGLLE